MNDFDLIFQGAAESNLLWLSIVVCLAAGGLIFKLMQYERQLVSRSVGTMLLNRTGSLVPLFAAVGVLQFLGGLFYGSSVETTTVQELMAAAAAKKGA